MGFSYRHCSAPDDVIFTSATLQGRAGETGEIAAEMADIRKSARRASRAVVPVALPKNPAGHSAWKLVDEAGCRGATIGGAQVSELHSNFLINLGGASAADIEIVGGNCAATGEVPFRRRSGVGNQTGRAGTLKS